MSCVVEGAARICLYESYMPGLLEIVSCVFEGAARICLYERVT